MFAFEDYKGATFNIYITIYSILTGSTLDPPEEEKQIGQRGHASENEQLTCAYLKSWHGP